jgi:hypothetical protein
MLQARAFWKTVYERFDPERPAEEHAWRVTRPYSPRDAIGRGLERPMGWPRHYMVFGTTGTGISTELRAAAEERSQVSMVVFLDLVDHFSRIVGDEAALQHVQAWEVLFLTGLAIHRSAQELFGSEWTARYQKDFQEAVSALRPATAGKRQPAIDVAKLVSAMVVAVGGPIGGLVGEGLRMLGEAGKSARWDFEIGRRDQPSLPDQDPRVRRLLDAVNQLVGAIQYEHQRLVVVIDGLDRIKSEETARRLFVDSTALGELSCAIVVDAPLLFKHTSLVTTVRHFTPLVLANVPVIDQFDHRRHGPGIEIMKDVFRLRVSDLEPGATLGIPEPLLGRLAYYSGGRMRDFVRLVRLVSEACWDRDLPLADEAAVDMCIDERRRIQELGITQEALEILKQVVAHPLHLLPESPLAQPLVEQNHLLPYPNESEWYLPHPLLTLHLLPLEPLPGSRGSGGSSGSPTAG